MPFNFLCPNPNCSASYSVADENLGKLGLCKKCGTKFALVPSTRAESPELSTDLDSFPIPADSNEEPLPASIGRYKVFKRLGRGGMGTVYLALDPKLDREVAVKVPHPEQSRDSVSRERFLREARAVAKFHHANFCPIFDIDESNDRPFLVMAYIQGRSLAESIEPGHPWNPRKAAGVVRQLALALAEAHRQGIVHRDLKPANVMVDTKGRLILMDFGLARKFDSADPTFTASGAILGTPAYMPPEQAEGDLKAIGPRSDIYSLGVILYELLSGRRPFEGAATRVLAQILMTDPQPPSTYHKDIDPSLERICLKAMARKLEIRYISMEQFAEALRSWTKEYRGPDPVKPANLTDMGGSRPDAANLRGSQRQPSTVRALENLPSIEVVGKPVAPYVPPPGPTTSRRRPSKDLPRDSPPKPVLKSEGAARDGIIYMAEDFNLYLDDNDAESIRRTYLKRENAIRSIGTLFYLFALLGTLCVVCMIFAFFYPSKPELSISSTEGGAVLVGYSIVTVLYWILGYSLRRLKPWARWLTVVLTSIWTIGITISSIALALSSPTSGVVLLLIGDGLFGSILYQMVSRKAGVVFSREYREIIEKTPHIKSRSGLILRIGCGLLVAVVFLLITLILYFE